MASRKKIPSIPGTSGFEIIHEPPSKVEEAASPINYRKASPECRLAWFAYQRAYPDSDLSLVDFTAGFNAALAAKVS